MKIFDWVHRRLHTNMEYCRVPRHKKVDPYVSDGGGEVVPAEKKVETENEALLMDLHHVASIQHVLDEILTIGTLGHLEYQCQKGFHDVGPHANQESYLQPVPLASKEESAAEDEKKDQEEEPPHPAVETAASAVHPNHNMIIESFKKEMLEILGGTNNGSSEIAGEEGDLLEPLLQATKAVRRERITLADLFMASEDDPAANKAEPTSLKVAPASARAAPEKEANGVMETKAKPASSAKRGGSSFTKKLTPRKKEGEDSSPPPKKLQRVIKRMLKKKIHPEMARDLINASVPSMQPCRRSVSTGESASLI